MVKVNRLITLDYEINEKLKDQSNASGFINDLLTEYFNKTKYEEMSIEELKKVVEIEKLEKKFKEEINKIKNG